MKKKLLKAVWKWQQRVTVGQAGGEERGSAAFATRKLPTCRWGPSTSVNLFFLFFSLPLYFCAHIHISDFSRPSFHPQPHLSVWKLSPLHREPLKTCWLVCFWEQHLWKNYSTWILDFCIKTAKEGNINWPFVSKTLLGMALKWLKGCTTKIRGKKDKSNKSERKWKAAWW